MVPFTANDGEPVRHRRSVQICFFLCRWVENVTAQCLFRSAAHCFAPPELHYAAARRLTVSVLTDTLKMS